MTEVIATETNNRDLTNCFGHIVLCGFVLAPSLRRSETPKRIGEMR